MAGVVLTGILAVTPAAAGTALLPISGTLRLAMCGAPDCERPPQDSPAWKTYALGPGGIPDGVGHREGIGWAVVSFVATPETLALREPTLLLATPADAEVLALNDAAAGGAGVIASRYLAHPEGARTHPLPRAALRPGPNELVMKLLFVRISSSAFSAPLLVGEHDSAELERQRLLGRRRFSEGAFLSLFLLMVALFLFLIARGFVRSDYLLFTSFLALNTAVFLLDSHVVHDAGLASPWSELAQAVTRRALNVITLALVTAVTGARFRWAFAGFAAPAVALVVLELLAPPLWALHWLATPRKALIGGLAVYYLFLAVRAIQQRRPDAWPAFFGIAAYVAGSRLDVYLGIGAREHGTAAFALAMLFAIISRHARLRARIELISARLLDAHEEERRRIARDIHDGVGQSLLALRLKLQMLAGRGERRDEALPGLAAEAGAIVEELRRTVLNLRPVFSDTDAYAPAMRDYAAAVCARSGLELHFHEGRRALPPLPQQTRTHFFRIFQEMLANVARHARAGRVHVSLHRGISTLVLQVSDDGAGFDPGAPTGGIGLETMRERAELLGGTLSVESMPRRGTIVTAEIPLR